MYDKIHYKLKKKNKKKKKIDCPPPVLSAELWSNVQQRPWNLHGILLDLHFFYQNSPFSVTSLPMISFSFLSICYIYCGPLMQAQSQPRTATFHSLVQLKQQSLTSSSGPSTLMTEGYRGFSSYLDRQRGLWESVWSGLSLSWWNERV